MDTQEEEEAVDVGVGYRARDCGACTKLKLRFDNHMTQHRIDAIDYEARQVRQDECHEKNMEAIDKLTKATSGLVTAYSTADNLQKFIVWLSKFSILGGALYWLASKVPVPITELFK